MSNPLTPCDRAGLSRLRDYLYDNGPTTVIEAAAALDMSPARVSSLLADGRVAPAAPAGGSDRRCAACGHPAAVNDLCRECRRGFREAARAGAGYERSSEAGRSSGSGVSWGVRGESSSQST